MGRFQGKIALVMGASRPNNMGQAIARRLRRNPTAAEIGAAVAPVTEVAATRGPP